MCLQQFYFNFNKDSDKYVQFYRINIYLEIIKTQFPRKTYFVKEN